MTTADATGLVVGTAAGAVRGRREGGLTVFRGIPFAAPPVEFRLFMVLGDLRAKVTEEQASGVLRLFAPGGEAGERAYREAFPDAGPADLFERVQSDWLFHIPSLRLAEAQVAGGGRAHVYELTWPAPGMGGALGACHGLDIPLLFGTYQADLGNLLFAGAEVTDEARSLTARFHSAWTSFAHTGDPGWPAYDGDRRLVQVLDTQPKVTPYPEEASRRLWEGRDFPPLPLLGDGQEQDQDQDRS